MKKMNQPAQPISLAIAMREVYKLSNWYLYLAYLIQLLFFLTNLYLIVNDSTKTNKSIWLVLVVSIGILILNFFFLRQSKKYYELGENLRKLDMIKRIFQNADNKTDKSYVIARIPSRIIKKAQMNPDEKTDYYTDKQTQYGKLIENIQQNCYFTSEIMRSYSNIILAAIIFILIALGISIFYGFFLLSEYKIGNELSENISSYLSILINFIFAINIIDHYLLFDKKAKDLKKIDLELNKLKQDPHEDEVITSFADYNCILSDALPCPDFVYTWNKVKLNSVWENRVNND